MKKTSFLDQLFKQKCQNVVQILLLLYLVAVKDLSLDEVQPEKKNSQK